uniref:WGS project CAEQ00000000 data, annotated contig 1446 n=1 Tax=Trypanosoma congolense (strain IL3000) TaxID=1068625 RepID=F9W6B5_TRYCI|nr:unnamed protein product [Trypanosoma congolense IL3000]
MHGVHFPSCEAEKKGTDTAGNASAPLCSVWLQDLLKADDHEVVSSLCLDVFAKTEASGRSVIENGEYLERLSADRDFRRLKSLWTPNPSIVNTTHRSSIGASNSGREDHDQSSTLGWYEEGSRNRVSCGEGLSGVDMLREPSALRHLCDESAPLCRGLFVEGGDDAAVSGVEHASSVRSYGTLAGGGCDDQSVSVDVGEVTCSSMRPHYNDEFPVFSCVNFLDPTFRDAGDPDRPVDHSCGSGVVATSKGGKRGQWVSSMAVHLLAVSIISALFLRNGSYALVGQTYSTAGTAQKQHITSVLVSIHAAGTALFLTVALMCFRWCNLLPHNVLLASVTVTIIDTLCASYGFFSHVDYPLAMSEGLQAISLACALVSLLFLTCVNAEGVVGPPLLALLLCQVWFVCGVFNLIAFPTSIYGISTTLVEVLGASFVMVLVVLTAGVYYLVPPAVFQPLLLTAADATASLGFLSCIRSINVSFWFRSVACGCLVAICHLLVVYCTGIALWGPGHLTPKSFNATGDRSAVSAVNTDGMDSVALMFLTAAVALPVGVVPQFGPLVHFVELGPAAAAVIFLVLVTFDGSTLTIALSIGCGAAAGVSLAGLWRSLAAVRWERLVAQGFPEKRVRCVAAASRVGDIALLAVAPVVVTAVVCSGCVALAVGLSVWIPSVCGDHKLGFGCDDTSRPGHGHAVRLIAVVLGSVTLILELISGLLCFFTSSHTHHAGTAR